MIKNNRKSTAIFTYVNAETEKKRVYAENRGKSGIYRWISKKSGKSYIGSSVNLSLRLKNYYQISYLKSSKSNSIIYRALLKHGYSNFSLEILEHCERGLTLKREQYYLDLFKPEYNILKIAGSRLGSKHSEIAKALMSLNYKPSLLRKTNHLLATTKGFTISIINKKNNTKKLYISMRAAANDIGVSHTTILNYINKDKLLKGIYSITRNR